MADVELLPLPELPRQVEGYNSDYWEAGQIEEYAADYARANVAHATAAKDAEIEALRAEVERLRTDLMESDEIREKLGHLLTRTAAALKGEPPAGVWHSWHDLPEKAAQLAKALEEIRSRSSINLAMHPNPFELTARLGDIYQIADAVLPKENKA